MNGGRGDGKPESEAAEVAFNGFIRLGKGLKNTGQRIGCDADAVIGDGDDDLVFFVAAADADRSVEGREFGGVF